LLPGAAHPRLTIDLPGPPRAGLSHVQGVAMREEYDPDVHGSYGAWLRSKNIQARPTGWTHATRDQTREYVGNDGRRVKDVTDQLGNRVVQHGRDQQSVH
ncbi:hypothetical protein JYK22_21520, partial [Nonomuraea sp. RK-328]|nr:hypothetical protein [Nonomuraea sp. RK-328]